MSHFLPTYSKMKIETLNLIAAILKAQGRTSPSYYRISEGSELPLYVSFISSSWNLINQI
jgi:hypothetical protein